MRSPLLQLVPILAALFCLGTLAACGALDLGGYDWEPSVGGGTGTGYGGSGGFSSSGPSGGAGATSFSYEAYCGLTCVPGTNTAASCDAGDPGGAGGAGGAGSGTTGSTGGAGGCTTGSTGGAGGAGGGGTGGYPGAIVDDCRLGADAEGVVAGECVETDTGKPAPLGAECLDSSTCGAGQGCVTVGMSRQCRPYCCGEVELCPAETYCALRPVAGEATAPVIPVCVAADGCDLGEPCPDAEKTCTVVRLTGQVTSCVTPGAGKLGESCPCAAGHFCDTQQNTCLQFCELNVSNACPPDYGCQGGSTSVPSGFGTCVAIN